jgi:hypothetical protein
VAVAVVAVAWRGGYGDNARAVTAVLAGLAALGAWAWAPDLVARASHAPVVVALAALAALAALSAAWTIGEPQDALRDAVAVLALAAVVVAASAVRSAAVPAGILLAVACASAVVGVAAAIGASDPRALDICGTWRPAGTFEYSPTLALVCAGALPVALRAATARRRAAAGGGMAAAWLLATTVALTANRAGIGLAAGALVAAVWLAPRDRPAGPLALAVIAGAAISALIVHGDLAPASAALLVASLAVVIPLGILAAALSAAPTGGVGAHRRWIAIVAIGAVAATAGGVLADRTSGCGGEATHGRTGIWQAGLDTAKERPLQGFGSATFGRASRAHQLEHRPRPTRFAHNLLLEGWVELGIAGLLLVAAWYAGVFALLRRALRADPARTGLLGPAVAAFPLANLLDWPWHLLGAGVLWAIAAGGLLACLDGEHMISSYT